MHLYSYITAVHVPPFLHGFAAQGSITEQTKDNVLLKATPVIGIQVSRLENFCEYQDAENTARPARIYPVETCLAIILNVFIYEVVSRLLCCQEEECNEDFGVQYLKGCVRPTSVGGLQLEPI